MPLRRLAGVCLWLPFLVACGGSPAATTSAPSPAASPVPAFSYTISGIVRDGFDGSPLPGVNVWIFQNIVAVTDETGHFSFVATSINAGGTPYLAFDKGGFNGAGSGVIYVGNAIVVDVTLPRACAALPNLAPTANVQPAFVDFDWHGERTSTVVTWMLEIGIITAANPAIIDPLGPLVTPNILSQDVGPNTSFHWQPRVISPGRYWARVRARNNCGLGWPSEFTVFTVSQ
jgi:hypothetical protein